MPELYNGLKDLSSTGKEIDWNGYKRSSLLISGCLMHHEDTYKRGVRMKYCGTHLTFGETVNDRLKLLEADFCRDRLCPMCTWRRSQKLFGQTRQLMAAITAKEQLRYIFLTLTVKNCVADDLSRTIDELIKGFQRLMRRKEVKAKTLGAVRQLEVTFNANPFSKAFRTYHPHLHIIFAVRESYFSSLRADYKMISQKQWREMWAECMSLDYDPQVDVRSIYGSPEQAVAEISKYPVKMQSILKIKQEDLMDFAVYNMAVGLISKRLIEYYGVFREYRRLLKLEDVESGDLVHTDNDDDGDELTGVIRRYQWRIGCYVEVPAFAGDVIFDDTFDFKQWLADSCKFRVSDFLTLYNDLQIYDKYLNFDAFDVIDKAQCEADLAAIRNFYLADTGRRDWDAQVARLTIGNRGYRYGF